MRVSDEDLKLLLVQLNCYTQTGDAGEKVTLVSKVRMENALLDLCDVRDENKRLREMLRAHGIAGKDEHLGEDPRAVLRDILSELDEINGWRPTALQPGGMLYERAKKIAGKE